MINCKSSCYLLDGHYSLNGKKLNSFACLDEDDTDTHDDEVGVEDATGKPIFFWDFFPPKIP